MPKLASFVLEASNNPGTGPFALSGAPAGRRGWSGAFEDGEVYYCADDGTQAEWGIGRLTHGTPAVITRDKVLGTTQDRTDRLNFTGLVYVYSDLPAEAVPPPVTQGIKTLPESVWTSALQTLGSLDVTASGTTLRAEFAANLQVVPDATASGSWLAVRTVIGIWTVDAQGNSPAQPMAATGANTRIDRSYAQTVTARFMATNLTPGTKLRIGASVQVITGSQGSTPLTLKMTDAAFTWISV
ncbi:hypothetical protein [Asaia sp. VD9]|uniref:hypothetical protein n=2 Tax=unclassified Asaia TaxID=2685023 RepID=UPI003019ADE4